MVTRKKPKWGYQTRPMFYDDGVQIYTDSVISTLAENHKIVGTPAKDDLRKCLEGSARIYRNQKQNWNDLPRRGEIGAAINEIKELTNRLRDNLENLDDVTCHLFWKPEIELETLIFTSNAAESRFGHSIARTASGEGSFDISYIGQSGIFEALHILNSYCVEALQNLPEDRGGPRRDLALRLWVINMKSYWEETLERQFTMHAYKGDEPLSDAAQFCVDVYQAIDPSTPNTTIFNMMSKIIREDRSNSK